MKGATAFFVFMSILAVAISAMGFYSFYNARNDDFEMEKYTVKVQSIDDLDISKHPSFYLCTESFDCEVPSIWYGEFDKKSFLEDFYKGKEYTVYINANDADDLDKDSVVNAYGISSDEKTYLAVEDAISSDRSNGFLGLVLGIAGLAGAAFLIYVLADMIKHG